MYLSTEQYHISIPHPAIPRFEVETLLEKGSAELNEDVLFTAGNLFGVFDGATSLGRKKYRNGLTGGLLAASTAARIFEEGQGSLLQIAQEANFCIRESQQRLGISLKEKYRLWSTSMAVVRFSEDRFEYCQTGDALIMLIRSDGSHRLVTPDIDIDSETLQLWKKLPVSAETRIQEALKEQIQQVRMRMNVSYGVLNGEPGAMDFLRHGFEELEGISDILIFTDGLFLPRENPLEENDWTSFVKIYLRGGLAAIHGQVRRLQKEDPACRTYPRFKLHDDIGAIAIHLH